MVPISANKADPSQVKKAEAFHALHVRGHPLVLFNVWDPGSAKTVAASGASALATGSWSVAAAHGFPDGEKIPLDLVFDNLRRIGAASTLPVSVDLETGYGDGSEGVGNTIVRAIESGAVGCNLEDSFPADGSLRDIKTQALRLRAAREAAAAQGLRFFINARCDVFFQKGMAHDAKALAQAVERAQAYADAGADGLFTPGLTDMALIERLAKESPLPLNIMIASTTPPLDVLARIGVARVSHGPGPYLVAMKALESHARAAYGSGL